MKVYVVTGSDLGWDCVVGVYPADTDYDALVRQFPYPEYFIFEREVEKFIPDFDE